MCVNESSEGTVLSFAQQLELHEKVLSLGKPLTSTLGGNKATSTSEGEGELQLSFLFLQ